MVASSLGLPDKLELVLSGTKILEQFSLLKLRNDRQAIAVDIPPPYGTSLEMRGPQHHSPLARDGRYNRGDDRTMYTT